MASESGRRIVEMVWEDLKPSDVLSAKGFENAITADMAIGGSTNAIIHLIAMAGRAGIKLPLTTFRRDFPAHAGDREYPPVRRIFDGRFPRRRRASRCSTASAICFTSIAKPSPATRSASRSPTQKSSTTRSFSPSTSPFPKPAATFVLHGNLAPDGCVIKPTAAEPRLLQHTGPAVVFKTYADLKARIDGEALNITADSVIVLQSAGPIGAPGIPEWGMLPIPKKLLKQGVRDMIRISDARMSGTSYGACVLHVSPESAIGGPIALVRDGDLIELDVKGRRIHLHVSDAELARRRAEWKPPEERFGRGYGKLFCAETTQAHEGCDFKFLHAGKATPEPDIY